MLDLDVDMWIYMFQFLIGKVQRSMQVKEEEKF